MFFMIDLKRHLKKNETLLIITIFIFALIIRFFLLSNESLWMDETYHIFYNQKNIIDAIKHTSFSSTEGVHPPLYNIFFNIWLHVFGLSEFSARSLSAIFGALSVILIYLFGKIMFNKRIGLYSALILTVSPFNVYYSQEARSYSLLSLLAMISFYFFYKYTISKSKKNIICYIISSFLLLYTHNHAVFIIISQNIYFLLINIKKFNELKKWLIIQLILFLLYSPWIFVLLFFQIPIVASPTHWLDQPTTLILIYFSRLFGGEQKELTVFILFFIMSILIFIYILKIFHKSSKKDVVKENKLYLLFLWLLFPTTISVLFSLLFFPIFLPKYVIYSSIPLYILVALAISKLSKKTLIQYVLLSLIIVISSFALLNLFTTTNKEDWRSVSEHIKNNIADDDIIIICSPWARIPFMYYYDQDCFVSGYFNKCIRENNIYPVANTSNLEKIGDLNEKSVWLILSHSKYVDPKNSIFQYLLTTKKLVAKKFFVGIEASYFKKNESINNFTNI